MSPATVGERDMTPGMNPCEAARPRNWEWLGLGNQMSINSLETSRLSSLTSSHTVPFLWVIILLFISTAPLAPFHACPSAEVSSTQVFQLFLRHFDTFFSFRAGICCNPDTFQRYRFHGFHTSGLTNKPFKHVTLHVLPGRLFQAISAGAASI